MKSALTVLLFPSLLIGVFVDGEESHMFVSVMEGDSVTLKSGVPELKSDGIEWRFNRTRLAKFKIGSIDLLPSIDRMQLDTKTGDLKISNIRTTDSGEYKLQISRDKDPPPDFIFNVSVSAAEVKSVMEGDSVTLPTGHTDLQKDDVIRWRFRQEESLLAEIISTSEERFRNTHLDRTGSLIFKNITTEQSGLYEAEIISTRSRYTVHRSFSVTVRDDVESVSVLEGDTVTLLTGLKETERIKQILWKSGDETIADLNSPVNKNWSNVYLNRTTGDLTISNIRNNQYNYYEVKIHTTAVIFHRKYLVTGSGLSPAAAAGIGVGGVIGGVIGGFIAGVLFTVAAFLIYRRRCKKPRTIREEKGQNGADGPINEETNLSSDPSML